MKIRELKGLIHDSICIYRKNPYISGEYINICTGSIDLVPDNILDMEIRSIGAKRKGIVDIRVD